MWTFVKERIVFGAIDHLMLASRVFNYTSNFAHRLALVFTLERSIAQGPVDYEKVIEMLLQDSRFKHMIQNEISKQSTLADFEKKLEESYERIIRDLEENLSVGDLKLQFDEKITFGEKFSQTLETKLVAFEHQLLSAKEEQERKMSEFKAEAEKSRMEFGNLMESNGNHVEQTEHLLLEKIQELEGKISQLRIELKKCSSAEMNKQALDESVVQILKQFQRSEFITRAEFDKLLSEAKIDILANMELETQNLLIENIYQHLRNSTVSLSPSNVNISEIEELVNNALKTYDADKTGMFDYALETSGGSVLSTRCTVTYTERSGSWSFLNGLFSLNWWPLRSSSTSPRKASNLAYNRVSAGPLKAPKAA